VICCQLYSLAVQVDAIREATSAVLACSKANRFDDAALAASAKLLTVVPEVTLMLEPTCQPSL
jgi:hypothetical protein